jgi:hypothetical protein
MLQEAAASVVFDPSDEFSFPWESHGVTDTAPPDTDTPADSTEPDGSENNDESGDTDDAEGTTDAPSGSAIPSTEPTDESKSSGCAVQPSHTGWMAILLATLGLFGRRQH